MTQPSIAADEPTPGVVPTPDHVTWADVMAKTNMPPVWEKVGNPDPIPGSALVLTRFHDKRTKRRLTQVLTWDMETGKMEVLKDSHNERAIYTNATDAREVQHDIARMLRKAGRG